MYYSNEPITLEHAASLCPAIVANEQHASRSTKYNHFPTALVLKELMNEGFNIHGVTAANNRDASKKGYGKHLIRLRKEQHALSNEAPELVLLNSHDGSCSYQLLTGIIRFACANGLIAGDIANTICVKHQGQDQTIENVIDASYEVVQDFETVTNSVQEMKAIELQPNEQELLAESALHLKFPKVSEAIANHESGARFPIKPSQLLQVRRPDDNKSDLWTTFNRMQEAIIRGGNRGFTKDSKTGRVRRMKTREVKGIDQNKALNTALWNLAEGMKELKQKAVV